MASTPEATTNDASTTPSTPPEEVNPDHSDDESAQENDLGGDAASSASKKKKKKRKTPAQKKAAAAAREQAQSSTTSKEVPPSVLKISRNKHMKGPWLQLPHEVLDTLLSVNCDPSALPTVRGLVEPPSSTPNLDRARFHAISASPHDSTRRSPSPPALLKADIAADATPVNGSHLPSPIDPAVFRGVSHIRKLVDDAADLAVRAAVGMSAAALGSFGPGNGAPPLSSGLDVGGGRNAAMSPVRQHRLRVLAVAKLAEAYRVDEIAASVAVMQGATGLDDLAQRVLKQEPDNLDAQYVHFHHEKIPSRTLASSTETTQLDHLIACDPNRLEYYRTRGIVHGFKGDYTAAARNFTQALTQVKAIRKEKEHRAEAGANGKKKKGSAKGGKSSGKKSSKDAPMNGSTNIDSETAASNGINASESDISATVGKEPGDDLERQMLFHRGMAHFHHACKLMEDAALDVEGVEKPPGGLSNEGGELTLRNVGIVLSDEVGGLYGCSAPEKQQRYREMMGEASLREKVTTLLRKSVRDHERFLAYFKVWEAPPGTPLEEEDRHKPTLGARQTDRPLTFRGRRLIHHRALAQRTRDADPRRTEKAHRHQEVPTPAPALLTTYHPLIIESHFAVLLNLLLLGDFTTLVQAHARTVRLMDHLEGYPVFLPARSLTMSEYAEVLERLSATWRVKRESSGIPAPDLETTEQDLANSGSDLQCLHQLTGFFSPEFVEALVRQAERETVQFEAEKTSLLKKSKKVLENGGSVGSGKAKMITANGEDDAMTTNPTKGKWKEERDKADAERRKIDPSYATYNTARAEVALAWITAVIIPEKEAEEPQVQAQSSQSQSLSPPKDNGKGKGKSMSSTSDEPSSSCSTFHLQGSSSAASGSSSRTAGNYDDDDD